MDLNREILGVIVALVALTSGIVVVVGPLARAYAEQWLKARQEAILARLPGNVRKAIEDAALNAARAVEQMQVAGYIEKEAKTMLKKAEELGESWLKAQGYNVELDALRTAIENVIWRGEHKKPSSPPAPIAASVETLLTPLPAEGMPASSSVAVLVAQGSSEPASG